MTDETRIKEEVNNLTLWDSIVYLCDFSDKFSILSEGEYGEHFANASGLIYEAVKEIQRWRELHCTHKEQVKQDFIDFRKENSSMKKHNDLKLIPVKDAFAHPERLRTRDGRKILFIWKNEKFGVYKGVNPVLCEVEGEIFNKGYRWKNGFIIPSFRGDSAPSPYDLFYQE